MNTADLTAQERMDKVLKVQALIAEKRSVKAALREAGTSRSNFYRWEALLDAGGLPALRPGKPTGRPPSVHLTPEERSAARLHALSAGGADKGIAQWMEESALLPDQRRYPSWVIASPATMAALEACIKKAGQGRPTWPDAIRRAARTTKMERAAWRKAQSTPHS